MTIFYKSTFPNDRNWSFIWFCNGMPFGTEYVCCNSTLSIQSLDFCESGSSHVFVLMVGNDFLERCVYSCSPTMQPIILNNPVLKQIFWHLSNSLVDLLLSPGKLTDKCQMLTLGSLQFALHKCGPGPSSCGCMIPCFVYSSLKDRGLRHRKFTEGSKSLQKF